MKFPFSADEIQRGLIILSLGLIAGLIIGLVSWCSAIPPTPTVILPSYNPFEEGINPEIQSPPLYNDFKFSLPGLPRFRPKWKTLIEPGEVLKPEDFNKEWDRLGDPKLLFLSDEDLETALDDLILDR